MAGDMGLAKWWLKIRGWKLLQGDRSGCNINCEVMARSSEARSCSIYTRLRVLCSSCITPENKFQL